MNKIAPAAIPVFLFLFGSFSAFAQPKKGDLDLSPAIGAGFTYSVGSISMPPVGASLDYNLDEKVSVGGIATYARSSFPLSDGKYALNYITVGARAFYHFSGTEKLDPYAGVFLGYTIFTATWKGANADPDYNFNFSLFHPGAFGGGRYKLKERLSLFAELGYPILRAGVNLKL